MIKSRRAPRSGSAEWTRQPFPRRSVRRAQQGACAWVMRIESLTRCIVQGRSKKPERSLTGFGRLVTFSIRIRTMALEDSQRLIVSVDVPREFATAGEGNWQAQLIPFGP